MMICQPEIGDRNSLIILHSCCFLGGVKSEGSEGPELRRIWTKHYIILFHSYGIFCAMYRVQQVIIN